MLLAGKPGNSIAGSGTGAQERVKKHKQIVWVIMHYEFIGLPQWRHIDSVQFHVSSSLTKAEKYIGDTWVEAHSWWQVHPHVVDAKGDDASTEGEEVYYYSHRGNRLHSAPIKRASIAFDKYTARHPELYRSSPSNQV
jgi:hypothetical protein